jgi:gamma-glutamyltranspeptidase/glutathione hydrolase
MTAKGVVTAGHPETAEAAVTILEAGGNAFDAALAAACAACVVEPVLISLGGGGFLMARRAPRDARTRAEAEPVLYDFFAHTPRRRRPPDECDFFPIVADFGPAQQEFHTGMGSIATPGVVKGMFQVNEDLGRLPFARIIEPAVELARSGVRVNRLQAYAFGVVGAIYRYGAESRRIFGSGRHEGQLVGEGEILTMRGFADVLEALAREGPKLFYEGDIAKMIDEACRTHGGSLERADLAGYRVRKRKPLSLDYDGARLHTNPPPSLGGILMAFAFELLRGADLAKTSFGSVAHLERLATAMNLSNRARVESGLHEAPDGAARLLDAGLLAQYRGRVLGQPTFSRGTTHISVIDGHGNAAAMTVSNGEGATYVIPGTDIMLNNMLGEEDLNPLGFHRWPVDTRISSMMAPTLVVWPDGRTAALGSGGSNRIRTAMLQVVLDLLVFGMPVSDAVGSPRIHLEDDLLSVEPGFPDEAVSALKAMVPRTDIWEERNMFFGGVHAVVADADRGLFTGAGDPRRDGVTRAA